MIHCGCRKEGYCAREAGAFPPDHKWTLCRKKIVVPRHEPTIPEGTFWWWIGVWMGNRINPIHPYNRMEPIEDEI